MQFGSYRKNMRYMIELWYKSRCERKGDSIVAKVTKEQISAKGFAIQIYTEDF